MYSSGSGVRLYDDPDLNLLILIGWGWNSCLLLGTPGSPCFSFAPYSNYDIWRPEISVVGQLTEFVNPRF